MQVNKNSVNEKVNTIFRQRNRPEEPDGFCYSI
jgi:hypothetical protein